MNIIFFKFTLSFGGGEVFNLNLIHKLREKKYKIKIYTNNFQFLKRLKKERIKSSWLYWGHEVGARRFIPFFILSYPLYYFLFCLILLFNKKSGKDNVVVFQSLNEKIIATNIAWKIGYKVIWIEHLSIDPWLVKNIFKNQYIKKSQRASKIVVISALIKKELVEILHMGESKIVIIYNGLDEKKYLNVTKQDIEKEKKLLNINDEIVIGSLGRLHSEKGLDILLKAYSILNKLNNNTRLVIVGEGSEKENLIKLARQLDIADKVIFAGFREDVAKIINIFDIFVLPSKVRESFGIVSVEAMMCKKIVIASNIGGIPEVVKDKETGFLFQPGNIEELSNLLIKVSQNIDQYKNTALNGYNYAMENFTLKKMAQNFEKIIIDIKK